MTNEEKQKIIQATKDAIARSPLHKKDKIKKDEDIFGPGTWEKAIEKIRLRQKVKNYNPKEFLKFYERQDCFEDI
jgi:hypothetical protein